jgi:hypothetical protein
VNGSGRIYLAVTIGEITRGRADHERRDHEHPEAVAAKDQRTHGDGK